jgi:hypothetical protein
MKGLVKACVMLLVVFALTVPGLAQKADTAKGAKKSETASPSEKPDRAKPAIKYDVANEIKLTGTIEEVKKIADDTHLMVKAGGQLLEIDLAPSSFLSDMECAFAKGDVVEIVGSKVKLESGEQMLARQITKGQLTLTLRDPKGAPVWDWKRS